MSSRSLSDIQTRAEGESLYVRERSDANVLTWFKNDPAYEFIGKVIRAVPRRDNWRGGCIFIYPCSRTVKTIAFKRNPFGRTRIYEYTPPPPIIALATNQ